MTTLDAYADDSPAAPGRFDAYLANARNGRNGVGRIILSILVIGGCWVIGTIAVFGCGLFYVSAGIDDGRGRLVTMLDGATTTRMLSGQLGIVVLLSSIATIWLGVWLAVRLVHKRRLSSLFGASQRLDRGDFWRAAAAAMAIGLLFTLLSLAIDPTIARSEISVRSWLLALPFMILLILAQSSAEEVLFRGYLHQTLAVRFASLFVWALLPTIAFTVLHWNGAISSAMNAAMLFSIASFSVVLTILLVRTGNLAAAIGTHFGNNIVAVLFVTSDMGIGNAALFQGKALGDPSWTTSDAILLAAGSLLSAVLILAVLFYRRSPLRLRSI